MIVVNARFLAQNITGIQRYAIELCKELKKINPEIIFVCPSNAKHRMMLDAIEIGANLGHLWEQIDLPYYLYKNGKPLLINLISSVPIIYSNQISSIYDIAFNINSDWYNFKYSFFYKLMTKFVIARSKKIISCSQFSIDEITKYYKTPSSKFEVIYGAVSPFDTSGNERINTGDSKYFLTLGSVSKRKNLIYLIRAFIEFSKNNQDYKLLIIGNLHIAILNKDDDEMQSMIATNSNIEVLGFVPDNQLSSLFQEASLFIYPSLYEGFGLPPLEAQYYNCPVAVSDIPIFREVYEDSVLYCSLDHTNSLTEIFHKIENKKIDIEELKRKGHENVKKYSWSESAIKLNQLISKVRTTQN